MRLFLILFLFVLSYQSFSQIKRVDSFSICDRKFKLAKNYSFTTNNQYRNTKSVFNTRSEAIIWDEIGNKESLNSNYNILLDDLELAHANNFTKKEVECFVFGKKEKGILFHYAIKNKKKSGYYLIVKTTINDCGLVIRYASLKEIISNNDIPIEFREIIKL